MEAALAPRSNGARTNPPSSLTSTGTYERPLRTQDRASDVAIHFLPTFERPSALPIDDGRAELPIRVLNVTVASIALLAAAPLMAIVALAIRVTSRGPAIYSQTR